MASMAAYEYGARGGYEKVEQFFGGAEAYGLGGSLLGKPFLFGINFSKAIGFFGSGAFAVAAIYFVWVAHQGNMLHKRNVDHRNLIFAAQCAYIGSSYNKSARQELSSSVSANDPRVDAIYNNSNALILSCIQVTKVE